MSKLTESQQKALGSYIRLSADTLGLRDWMFNVDHDGEVHKPADDDYETIMDITPLYGQQTANIRYNDEAILAMDGERLRHVVAHELTHVHVNKLLSLAHNELSEQLSQSTHTLFEAVFERELEHSVDAIAFLVERLLEEFDLNNKSHVDQLVEWHTEYRENQK